MKKWLIGHFLPMWAKQTVLRDNRRMARQIRELEQDMSRLRAYIRGMQAGMRSCRQTRQEDAK